MIIANMYTITKPSEVEGVQQQLLVLAWAAHRRFQAWALTYYSAVLSFQLVNLCSEKHYQLQVNNDECWLNTKHSLKPWPNGAFFVWAEMPAFPPAL